MKKAPWDDSLIERLHKHQFGPWDDIFEIGHPYTCGNRNNEKHKKYAVENDQSDYGILIPTRNGWKCPVCDYKQDWY